MKLQLFGLSAIALTMALATNSCGKGGDSASSADSLISSLEIDMNIKTASRSYSISNTDPATEFFLTISANVQWPEKIGDYDIKPLQDTIVSLAFPVAKTDKVEDAIIAYLADAKSYELGDQIKDVDQVPSTDENYNDFYNSVKVQMLEVNDQLATFAVAVSQFMGGAHPNSAVSPFTYDLSRAAVIDYSFLLKPGSEQQLVGPLSESICATLNLSETELNESLLNGFSISKTVYILDGLIYFHYNPYDILPYSFGAIDAPVQPYAVRDLLTPEAQKLLNV